MDGFAPSVPERDQSKAVKSSLSTRARYLPRDCHFSKRSLTMQRVGPILGPVSGPEVIGVLFINSDISGGASAGGGAQSVLEKAYTSALTPK